MFYLGVAVEVEADIDGVGVACGDGDDGALPAAVEIFAGPAVSYMEILVHGVSVSLWGGLGKGAMRRLSVLRRCDRNFLALKFSWRWKA
jgi:hypothetical protein